MASDEFYMKQALELAKKGLGKTSPNPAVGCVIVKDEKIVGHGYHDGAGLPHAEINALKEAGGKAKGATLYITLEPCAHHGRTPPCTEALKKAGVGKVVAAMIDPNPQVSGKGVAELVNGSIEVKMGVLEEDAKMMNEGYEKFITTGMPFVILKSAMSVDGKIATRTGDSEWISNEEARQHVHKLRSMVDAVLVGVNTVIKDDPQLTTRIPGGRNPKRIVVDTHLRIPKNAKVLDKQAKTIIATTSRVPMSTMKEIEDRGAKILVVTEKGGKVNLRDLIRELGKEEITSVLIEGGGEVNASALESGIVDKILFFISPQIIGGNEAVDVVGGKGIDSLKDSIKISKYNITKVGDDFLFEGYIQNV